MSIGITNTQIDKPTCFWLQFWGYGSILLALIVAIISLIDPFILIVLLPVVVFVVTFGFYIFFLTWIIESALKNYEKLGYKIAKIFFALTTFLILLPIIAILSEVFLHPFAGTGKNIKVFFLPILSPLFIPLLNSYFIYRLYSRRGSYTNESSSKPIRKIIIATGLFIAINVIAFLVWVLFLGKESPLIL